MPFGVNPLRGKFHETQNPGQPRYYVLPFRFVGLWQGTETPLLGQARTVLRKGDDESVREYHQVH